MAVEKPWEELLQCFLRPQSSAHREMLLLKKAAFDSTLHMK